MSTHMTMNSIYLHSLHYFINYMEFNAQIINKYFGNTYP